MINQGNDLQRIGVALWSDGRLRSQLSDGAIVVIDWKLDPPVAGAEKNLVAAEIARAERFQLEGLRAAFILARARLRTVLGGWLGVDPKEVAFSTTPRGKPKLSCDPSKPGLRFNLSHSGGVALLALALDQEVGIDIEHINPNKPLPLSVAAKCFTDRELTALEQAPEHAKPKFFYRLWTKKEAVAKLTGDGLHADLRTIETPVDPNQAGWVTLPPENGLGAKRGWLQPVDVEAGFQASLASEKQPAIVTRERLGPG